MEKLKKKTEIEKIETEKNIAGTNREGYAIRLVTMKHQAESCREAALVLRQSTANFVGARMDRSVL